MSKICVCMCARCIFLSFCFILTPVQEIVSGHSTGVNTETLVKPSGKGKIDNAQQTLWAHMFISHAVSRGLCFLCVFYPLWLLKYFLLLFHISFRSCVPRSLTLYTLLTCGFLYFFSVNGSLSHWLYLSFLGSFFLKANISHVFLHLKLENSSLFFPTVFMAKLVC